MEKGDLVLTLHGDACAPELISFVVDSLKKKCVPQLLALPPPPLHPVASIYIVACRHPSLPSLPVAILC